jgi:phosphatidate cytidylyltransferase
VRQRVISAVILLPSVILIFVFGGWIYNLLILTATVLAVFELVRMFRRKGYAFSLPLTLGIMVIWEANAVWPDRQWFAPAVAIAVLALSLWELLRLAGHPERLAPSEQWALTLAGASYLGLGGANLIGLRSEPGGLWWILTACGVVWIGDTAAYFVGRKWGRHKMAPTISPGKSWEGYAAQVVSGTAAGGLLVWLWPVLFGQAAILNVWQGFILGIVLSVFCPAGDFFVSMLKREVGVKDTGSLIPGHGGMLDRIDSLLWAGILGDLLAQLLA